MSENKPKKKPARQNATSSDASDGFTSEERAAMQERAQELKAARRGVRSKQEDGEGDVLAKIAEMDAGDRAMAERLHTLVKATAPELSPKTWYGMPAYAKDGKVVCFFQGAKKFKTRYATLGFSDTANLDDGDMWPSAFALKAWTPAVEERVSELVKTAVG
jgi:uncharacterized protein YdhG (YjbR/CyaY superfamily)